MYGSDKPTDSIQIAIKESDSHRASLHSKLSEGSPGVVLSRVTLHRVTDCRVFTSHLPSGTVNLARGAETGGIYIPQYFTNFEISGQEIPSKA